MQPRLIDRPNLDDRCGARHRYRDFIECGVTFSRLAMAGKLPADEAHLPTQVESWGWFRQMCEQIIDPLEAAFSPVVLTYGFAGPWLLRHHLTGIAPRLDQHAAAELGPRGALRCPRSGFAVDLVIPGTDSHHLARWLIGNTPFDRLYFYGSARPVHVSVGPEPAGYCAAMVEVGGRRIPRPGSSAGLR